MEASMLKRYVVIGNFYEKSAHLACRAMSRENAIALFNRRFGEKVEGWNIYATCEDDEHYWGVDLFNRLWSSGVSYFSGYTY